MTQPISVVVPARNEAGTIQDVVTKLIGFSWVDEIVVVDNASTDGTAEAATAAGARAAYEPRPGMGHALRTGIAAARNDWVMKVDADLDDFDTKRFALMPAAREEGVGLIKGHWQDPRNNMLMTRLLVRPTLRHLLPGLAEVAAPNSGIYLLDRRRIAYQEIAGSFAADLDVMLRVHASGGKVICVDIGSLGHAMRDLDHYSAQAETILGFLLEVQENRLAEELVVMACEARDLLGAGLGLFAARARAGAVVTIFLERPDAEDARILKDVMSPYPTVRILPIALAEGFRPYGPERRLCCFAPFPIEMNPEPLYAALKLRAGLLADRVESCELLLMQVSAGTDPRGSFRADYAFDVIQGLSLRQKVFDRMAALGGNPGGVFGSREAFQSFESLPTALRQALAGAPHGCVEGAV